MTHDNEQTPPADKGRLEASVRPRAWALPIPAMAGGGDYLRSVPQDFNYPSGEPMPWEPLYDQAALDAAVAAERVKWQRAYTNGYNDGVQDGRRTERERCVKLCEEVSREHFAADMTWESNGAAACAARLRMAQRAANRRPTA